MNEGKNNNIQAAIDAGAVLAQQISPAPPASGSKPVIALPQGYEVHDIEHTLKVPTRKRASVIVSDSGSFIAYTKKHGSLEDCVIYAEIDSEQSKCNLIAVINDNGADEPAWRDHTCTFTPKLAVEWKRWIQKNKATMSQADFAAWLEENLPDIAGVPGMPSGQDILQMALAFEANAEKRLRSKINLQSGGVRFEFVEDEDKDTRVSMQAFERFTLGIPVFDGSVNAYPLEARLKYRDKDGKLTFWYELIRSDRVFKTAVQDELHKIKEATGFMLLAGKP